MKQFKLLSKGRHPQIYSTGQVFSGVEGLAAECDMLKIKQVWK